MLAVDDGGEGEHGVVAVEDDGVEGRVLDDGHEGLEVGVLGVQLQQLRAAQLLRLVEGRRMERCSRRSRRRSRRRRGWRRRKRRRRTWYLVESPEPDVLGLLGHVEERALGGV